MGIICVLSPKEPNLQEHTYCQMIVTCSARTEPTKLASEAT
jgi:hypothetical protein